MYIGGGAVDNCWHPLAKTMQKQTLATVIKDNNNSVLRKSVSSKQYSLYSCVWVCACVRMYVCMCARACLHTLMVVASARITTTVCRPNNKYSSCSCVCVCMRVCVCVCVCTCMFAHVDGRVFGSYDSNSVVNWNRNNEEMHRYTMSFVCMKWILAGPAPMSIALPGPAAVSIALPIASFLCKRSNGLLRVKRKHVVCGLGR